MGLSKKQHNWNATTNITQYHDTTISYKPREPVSVLRRVVVFHTIERVNVRKEFVEVNSGLYRSLPYKFLQYGVLVDYLFQTRMQNAEGI